MRVRILTPLATLLDRADIAQLATADDSGGFAIRSGHAPFLTTLPPSVLRLRLADGGTLYAAVAGGMLQVDRDGVTVTSQDAAVGTDLAPLAARVEREQADRQTRRAEGTATERKLQAALVHHLLDSTAAERRAGGD
jgi:F-type H+-transporting ATPase subunit epsilon